MESNIESTNRKLASVQIISEVLPLKENNYLEIYKILGWQVIDKKGIYKQNQKIIYFEIDSEIKPMPWNNLKKGKSLKIMSKKVFNQLSQGYILPISKNLLNFLNVSEEELTIGLDLTSQLEINKYLNDSDNAKYFSNDFPDKLITRSDEPRIQSNQKYINLFKDKPYYISLKYDGMSGTYLLIDNEFYICSRNYRIIPSEKDNYTYVAKKYDLENKLRKMAENKRNYAIQGEIYGKKINGNYLEKDDIYFIVFTIKDIDNDKYLDLEEMKKVCNEMDLEYVKILETGEKFNYTEEDLKEKSKGNYEGTENPREGIVVRLLENWNEKGKERMSFKYVNDDYLEYKNQKNKKK